MIGDFNITIKDNFLEKNKFKDLYNNVPFYTYEHNMNSLENVNHVWYASAASDEVSEYLKNKCEKEFNIKLELNWCNFTMLATPKPVVHCDYVEDKCTHQVIVYLRGNENLNKGTGFYTTKNNINELNTHIGFKENRAIFWNSEIWHSPLNWSADDKSKRFSLIAQYKEIK